MPGSTGMRRFSRVLNSSKWHGKADDIGGYCPRAITSLGGYYYQYTTLVVVILSQN